MKNLRTLDDVDVLGKVVLCRVDLNVPMSHGRVEDPTRLVRVIPTIVELIKRQAKVVVISHLGRPGGEFVRDLSLAPLADALGDALGGCDVKFAVDCVGPLAKGAVSDMQNGDVLVLENLRFHVGEEKNNAKFVEALAGLGDIYVNDAFACSHRKHASIVGVAKKMPAVAGLLLQEELEYLQKYLGSPVLPLAAIVGGSKVSSKLGLIKALLESTSLLAIGGAMANTFLKAQGYDVGKSLCESDLVDEAKIILQQAEDNDCKIFLPEDVVVAGDLERRAVCRVVSVDKVKVDEMILDLGPNTIAKLAGRLSEFGTVLWNGPIGAFEYQPFDTSSIMLARHIAVLTEQESLISVAGGGDVVAALGGAGLIDSFSYVSTAGGAFLQWMQGKGLPGVDVVSR